MRWVLFGEVGRLLCLELGWVAEGRAAFGAVERLVCLGWVGVVVGLEGESRTGVGA